ncbi:hypothetical protein CRUP_034892, partial [Coryphaenoides rupestris]
GKTAPCAYSQKEGSGCQIVQSATHSLQSSTMEKVLLLMAVIATCCAAPQDLSGKIFIFPKETATDHVKLLTSKTQFQAVTSCLRYFTDITRGYTIFSMSTRSHINAYVIYKFGPTSMRILAQDATADFLMLPTPVNKWASICATWTSETGLTQVWMDGQPSSKRLIHQGSPISGTPMIILGQEQDSYGAGFDLKQSFVGMISDVHMWDYVLSPCELRDYAGSTSFSPGNVLNWRAMEFVIVGKVLVEQKQGLC